MTRVFARMFLAVAFAAVAWTPAAAAANREHQQLMADIRMLQEQTQQLQLMLGTLAEAIKTVNTRLDEQAGATRKAFADQKLLVDTVAEGVRILREKVDETNVRISSLTQEMEAIRVAIPPAGAGSPSTPPDPAQPTTPGETPAAPPSAPPTLAPGMTPKQLYDMAYSDYTLGQWDLAIAGFQTYVKSFPKLPDADEAQFYIGESYFASARFKEAAAAYGEVIANYPTANATPGAYYKQGLSFERLGQIDRAKEAYETVIKKHPDSNGQRLAKQALERINRAGR